MVGEAESLSIRMDRLSPGVKEFLRKKKIKVTHNMGGSHEEVELRSDSNYSKRSKKSSKQNSIHQTQNNFY